MAKKDKILTPDVPDHLCDYFYGSYIGFGGGGGGAVAGGYQISKSCLFNDDDSPRLYRTPANVGNRSIGTISLWYKRSNIGSIMQLFNSGAGDDIAFDAANQLIWTDGSGLSYKTTQVFRDTTAWGHLVFAWDTTLTTAGDRARIYHNGTEITAFATETNPDQNDALEISNIVRQTIGANEGDTEEFDGYLAEIHYIDGAQLTPTSFGEFDDYGVWRPIEFSSSGVSITEVVPSGTGTAIGDMTAAGGLAAAFNDDFDQARAAGARDTTNDTDCYIGKDWGSGNSKTITQIALTGSNDFGFTGGTVTMRFDFYGSNSAPSSATDGTLLMTGADFSDTQDALNKTYSELNQTEAAFTANQSVDTFGNATADQINHGLQFTSVGSGTVVQGRLNVGTVTTAVAVTMSVWTDSSGSPGSQIGGNSDELAISTTGIKTLTWSSNYPTLSASTLYWIVITDSTASGNVGLMRRSSSTGFIHGAHDTITSISTGSGSVNTSYPIQLELGIASTAYRYHWVRYIIPSADHKYMAEMQFYEAGTGYGTNGFYLNFAEANNLGLDATSTVSSTTYRYLKLNVTDNGASSTYVSLGEMEYYVGATLYPTQTMTSNTAPSPLVASASEDTGTGAGLAYLGFDDNINTHWQTANGTVTGHLIIDLGSGNGIAPTSFRLGAPETPDRTPNDFTIQGSNNGSDYTVLGTYAGFSTPTPTARTFSGYMAISSGNNWAVSGITSSDQVTDSPTNNFATFIEVGSGMTLSEGNLKITTTSTGWKVFPASLRIPDTGKWVYKVSVIGDVSTSPGYAGDSATGAGGAEYPMFKPWGVNAVAAGAMMGNFTTLYMGHGEIAAEVNESNSPQAGLTTLGTGDTCEVYLDNDAHTVKYYKNGSQVGSTITGLNTLNYAFHMIYYSGSSITWDFGQHGFTRTDDTYNYISTANFPAPAVSDGTANFQTTLYTGNGSSRNIDQTGNSTFQPDMVWIKNRDTTDEHKLIDATRGVQKKLNTDHYAVEATESTGLTSFDSDGFGLGAGANGYNDNTEKFVAWQWKAGGGSGSSNEDGSINTTTTSVNTAAGISIGTFTGTGSTATLGHGLGVVPKMIIVKQRDTDSSDWIVYHAGNTSAPQTDLLKLNETNATADDNTAWNDTAPTSTVFTIGPHAFTNPSSHTCVYYAFAEVEGFSRFSSYVGNGAASLGPPVFCGFRPAFVMIKKASGTGSWVMYDTQRSSFNEVDDQLHADATTAETTGSEEIDFLATGFRIRTAASDVYTSDGKYVYAAFASNPFGGDGVSPATAV